ncbi:class I SAM-dependent methyltransferase [Candidatus Woesearchaeota archaeon]|nr:class I SAM-dependent methyltransferase [Candidatus Woesearchaeota archaeon]
MGTYLKSCQSEFWKSVFKKELEYLVKELNACKEVLSVECGPAIIEGELQEYGINVTGLDVSKEALEGIPNNIIKIVVTAEYMDISDLSYDAVIYVVSLQFIENYKKAVKETARVPRSKGKIIIMLLNPNTGFFKERAKKNNSYVNKIKHTNLSKIKRIISK